MIPRMWRDEDFTSRVPGMEIPGRPIHPKPVQDPHPPHVSRLHARGDTQPGRRVGAGRALSGLRRARRHREEEPGLPRRGRAAQRREPGGRRAARAPLGALPRDRARRRGRGEAHRASRSALLRRGHQLLVRPDRPRAAAAHDRGGRRRRRAAARTARRWSRISTRSASRSGPRRRASTTPTTPTGAWPRRSSTWSAWRPPARTR